MRAAVTFVTVLLVIGAAQVFTQIFEITKGGPYNSTQSLMTYMYQQAFPTSRSATPPRSRHCWRSCSSALARWRFAFLSTARSSRGSE